MAICRPEHPVFKSSAEQLVWEQLRADLPDHAYILSNVSLTDDQGDYEADFVVAIPGAGIINVEVKGGFVQRRGDGSWVTTNDQGKTQTIEPGHQVKRNHYAIQRYVGSRWSQGTPKLAWMVAFPHSEIPADCDPPDLRRNRVIDRYEMPEIVDRIRTICHDTLHEVANSEYCKAFVRALEGQRDAQRDFIALKSAREELITRWTHEQKFILDMAQAEPQFKVVGPAGSGKTFLALEQTRRLARQGKEIALVCFSHGLARYLESVTESWPKADRPAFVGMFHELGKKVWKIAEPNQPTPHWYDVESAQEMMKVLTSNPTARKFDGFVVDEAQDMNPNWWNVIHAASRVGVATAPLCVFGDEDQRIFGGQGFSHLLMPTYTLSKNLRNTEPIAKVVCEFPKKRPTHHELPGPEVIFVPTKRAKAVELADGQIQELIQHGWAQGDLLVVTTGDRHPKHQQFRDDDKESYWQSFFGNDVFYAHVNGIKGLERPAVVLAMNGWSDRERIREFLYVGLSRARDVLVICGELDDLRSVGGNLEQMMKVQEEQ